MQVFFRKLFLILISSGFLFFSVDANAVAVVVNMGPVSVPPPPVYAEPPMGYENCYVVPSGYYEGYFVHAHQVCEYADSPYGGAWVAGFWQCGYYHNGHCGGRWAWLPGHWVLRGHAEYGVVWHDDHGYYHSGYHGGYHHFHDGNHDRYHDHGYGYH